MGAVLWTLWTPPFKNESKIIPIPQPSSVKSLRAERLLRTSLDLELDLQATRTWHSQLTQEISVLKELKEQLEQAKSHGEKELPQWLREDERFRLLLRMLEKRVSSRQGKEVAHTPWAEGTSLQGGVARALLRSHGTVNTESVPGTTHAHQEREPGVPPPSTLYSLWTGC